MGYSTYASFDCYMASQHGSLKMAIDFPEKEIISQMLELSLKEEADEFCISDNGNSLTGTAEFWNDHDDLLYLRLQKISLLNRMLVFDFEAKDTYEEYERVIVTNGIIWRGAGKVVYEQPDLKKIFGEITVDNEDSLEGLTEAQIETVYRFKEHQYRKQDAIRHIYEFFGLEEDEKPTDPEEFKKKYGFDFDHILNEADELAWVFIQDHDCNIAENTQWENLINQYEVAILQSIAQLKNERR